jgi:hypothetical protein
MKYLEAVSSIHDIFLTYIDTDGSLFVMNWFSFAVPY